MNIDSHLYISKNIKQKNKNIIDQTTHNFLFLIVKVTKIRIQCQY